MNKKKIQGMLLAAGMSIALYTGCGKSPEFEDSAQVSPTILSDEDSTSGTAGTSDAASQAEEKSSSETDEELYVGAYFDDVSDEPNLRIEKGENGKYHIEIGIYRLTSIDDGTGELTEKGLKFTATDAAGNPIGGVITREGDKAIVTFTDSTWGLIQNGDSFVYTIESK